MALSTSPQSTKRRWRPSLPCWRASSLEASASARRSSRSIRAAPIAGSDRSRSIATTGVGADFATGDKGGDPISPCRLSRGCFAGRSGAFARPNARYGNRGAPSWITPPIPSRLSRLPSLRKRRDKASNPKPVAARLRHARRPMRNPARSRRRGFMGASPMASGAMRRRKTKPPSTPRAGMRRTGKRRSARSHGAMATAGNSRLGRIIGPCSTCPISSRRPKAPVVICEGEKAAEAAAAIFPKSIATTSSGGAGAAAKTDWTPLARRSVLIWPDHDAAGEKYAREVAGDPRGAGLFGFHYRRQGAGGDRSGRRRARAARQMGRGRRDGGMARPCGAAQGGGAPAQRFRSGPGLCVLRRL